jgi:hypothetical protein
MALVNRSEPSSVHSSKGRFEVPPPQGSLRIRADHGGIRVYTFSNLCHGLPAGGLSNIKLLEWLYLAGLPLRASPKASASSTSG